MQHENQFQYDPSQFGITGMSPGYLQSLMEDIRRRGAVTRGRALAGQRARGMQYDDPSLGLARARAEAGTQQEMGQTVGGLAYQSWQVQQQQAERAKDRALQLQLARMGGRGGGYRPPIQYGKVPSLGGGPVLGGGGGMGEAPGGTGVPMGPSPGAPLQQRVEAAYNPPVVRGPRARPAYATPYQRR